MTYKITYESSDFKNGFKGSTDASIRNLADITKIEMAKLMPFATGALVNSLSSQQTGNLEHTIYDGVPYGIRRNFENNLHPNTLHFIERSLTNTVNGQVSRWWKSEL